MKQEDRSGERGDFGTKGEIAGSGVRSFAEDGVRPLETPGRR